jgi:Ras GTPase-activating-like protein IQGAP2/3
MIPTNSFVKENKQKINQFLNDICKVSDFYESLEMDQYMALSRQDLSIQITPNEIYSTHALLSQHKAQLVSDPTHHLHILLDELGPVPRLIERKQNHAIRLSLYSRWETDPTTEWDAIPNPPLETEQPCSENGITQNDLMYMEAKSTFVQILRCLPTLYVDDLDLPRIAKVATLSKDAQLVHKGTKVMNMLAMLEAADIVTSKNAYALLVQEIKQELNHLGDLRERVVHEKDSLAQVFQIIQDHNNYLKSQLEAYQTYLQNVRMQSAVGSGRMSTSDIFVDLVQIAKKKKRPSSLMKKVNCGSFKYSHHQLEKDGVIVETEVPEYRKSNIYLMIQSTGVGAFIISLHYKGREKPILEIDLKLDDLLEKVSKNKLVM